LTLISIVESSVYDQTKNYN